MPEERPHSPNKHNIEHVRFDCVFDALDRQKGCNQDLWNKVLGSELAVFSYKNSGGYGFLHLATQKGKTDIVRTLLDAGATPDIRSTDKGLTPLHLAAFACNTKVCDVLIMRGASPHCRNYKKETPLDYAGIVDKDITEADASEATKQIKATFEKARKFKTIFNTIEEGKGNTRKLWEEVLEEPLAIREYRNSEGETFLHLAASKGDPETCKLLIIKGANPYSANFKKQTPLDYVRHAEGRIGKENARKMTERMNLTHTKAQEAEAIFSGIQTGEENTPDLWLQALQDRLVREEYRSPEGLSFRDLALFTNAPEVARLLSGGASALNESPACCHKRPRNGFTQELWQEQRPKRTARASGSGMHL